MGRLEPFKAYRVAVDIADKLQARKQEEGRRDSMTAYVEWILGQYAAGRLTHAQAGAGNGLEEDAPVRVIAHRTARRDLGQQRKAG